MNSPEEYAAKLRAERRERYALAAIGGGYGVEESLDIADQLIEALYPPPPPVKRVEEPPPTPPVVLQHPR